MLANGDGALISLLCILCYAVDTAPHTTTHTVMPTDHIAPSPSKVLDSHWSSFGGACACRRLLVEAVTWTMHDTFLKTCHTKTCHTTRVPSHFFKIQPITSTNHRSDSCLPVLCSCQAQCICKAIPRAVDKHRLLPSGIMHLVVYNKSAVTWPATSLPTQRVNW